MGLLSWLRLSSTKSSTQATPGYFETVPAMNGAVEVPRPADLTVFEFGSSRNGVSLAGYCQVSNELQPCKWELGTASGPEVPLFKVLF